MRINGELRAFVHIKVRPMSDFLLRRKGHRFTREQLLDVIFKSLFCIAFYQRTQLTLSELDRVMNNEVL